MPATSAGMTDSSNLHSSHPLYHHNWSAGFVSHQVADPERLLLKPHSFLPARKAIGSPCTQSDWSVGQNPVTDQIKTSHFASNPASTRPPIGAFRETERKRTAENGQRTSKPLTNARQFVSTVYWPPDRAAAIDDLGSPSKSLRSRSLPPSPCGRDHFLSSYTAHHRHEFSRIKPINGLVQQGSPS